MILLLIFFISSLCFLNFILFFRNPVYAVFCFIYFILFIIFILLFLQVEFISYLLLIIYVGAIAVLFLFTIILLNIKDTLATSYALGRELLFIFAVIFVVFCVVQQNFIFLNGINYLNDLSFIFSNSLLLVYFNLDIHLFVHFFISYYLLFCICILILFVGIIGTALVMRN